LGGLWALECAWHISETNLRCAGISAICMPNPSIVAFIVSEISALIRTEEQTDRRIDSTSNPDQEYTLNGPTRCYILSDVSRIPFYSTSNGLKDNSPANLSRRQKGLPDFLHQKVQTLGNPLLQTWHLAWNKWRPPYRRPLTMPFKKQPTIGLLTTFCGQKFHFSKVVNFKM